MGQQSRQNAPLSRLGKKIGCVSERDRKEPYFLLRLQSKRSQCFSDSFEPWNRISLALLR